MKSDQADELSVSQLVRGQLHGVSSHVCHESYGSTGPLRPLGGILAAHVTEFCQWAASYAGSIGLLAGAEFQSDAHHSLEILYNTGELCSLLVHSLGAPYWGGLRIGGIF